MSHDTFLRLTAVLEILFALPVAMLCIPFVSAGLNWLCNHRRH